MVGKTSELPQLDASSSAELDEIEIRDISDTPNNDVQNKAMERRAFISERRTTIENVTIPAGCGLMFPSPYTIGDGFTLTLAEGAVLKVI